MATREEIIAVLRSKGYKGAIPGEEAEQPQGTFVTGLIDKIDPSGRLTNSLRGAAQGFTGQKIGGLQSGSDLSDFRAKEIFKQSIKTPTPETDLARARREKIEIENLKAEEFQNDPEGFIERNAGRYPAGTTMQLGQFNVPLNLRLTESEQAASAGVASLEPIISSIKERIRGGTLKSEGFGDIGRTVRQATAGTGKALLTSFDKDLQALQSDMNAIKGQLPFTAGGKQLTQTEKELVFRLLDLTGKNDDQIIKDIDQAMSILREKERLALSGMAGVSKPQTTSTQLGTSKYKIEVIQ